MKKLLEVETGKCFCVSQDIVLFGGAIQSQVDAGNYKWFDVPQNENPRDCVLAPDKQSLVVDPVKKQARLDLIAAQETQRTQIQTLAQRLDAIDSLQDLTAAEVKELVRKLFKIVKLKGII